MNVPSKEELEALWEKGGFDTIAEHATAAADQDAQAILHTAFNDAFSNAHVELKQLREQNAALKDVLIMCRNRLMGGYYAQSTMLPDEQILGKINAVLE